MRWLWLNTITEFLRKHRVLSLGLTLISVVGFLIGTIGYFQDRGDAKATTRQVFAVERKIENLLALARANESESDYRELVREVRNLLNARDLSSRNANAFLKELSDQLDAAIAELANSPDRLPNQASIPATASADANSSPDTFSEAPTPRSIEQQPFSREPPVAHAGSRKASATETDISHLGPTGHVKYQTANQRVDSAQFSPSSLHDSTHEQAIAPKSRLTFVAPKGTRPYFVSSDAVLIVYDAPNQFSQVLAELPYGKLVRVESFQDDQQMNDGQAKWVYILFDGDRGGYVESAFISKLSGSARSFRDYRMGNFAFHRGNSYEASIYWRNSLTHATNEVERIRALGALAHMAAAEGDMGLARGYAEAVLAIDPKNAFAADMLEKAAYFFAAPIEIQTQSTGQPAIVE
jgi:hypothetical protein